MALKDTRESVESELIYVLFDDAVDTAEGRGLTRQEAIAEYITTMRISAAIEEGTF